ncbi:14544_t:CDS:2, partial [Dentiscutata heterogama]
AVRLKKMAPPPRVAKYEFSSDIINQQINDSFEDKNEPDSELLAGEGSITGIAEIDELK